MNSYSTMLSNSTSLSGRTPPNGASLAPRKAIRILRHSSKEGQGITAQGDVTKRVIDMAIILAVLEILRRLCSGYTRPPTSFDVIVYLLMFHIDYKKS